MTAQDKIRHHGLRLKTPAPRIQEIRKYPIRAPLREEVQHMRRGLRAEVYSVAAGLLGFAALMVLAGVAGYVAGIYGRRLPKGSRPWGWGLSS